MAEQVPGASPTEWARVFYSLETDEKGRMSIDLEGQSIPSLPGIQFAFRLTPGTTPEQAAKLVEMLEETALCSWQGSWTASTAMTTS